MNKDFQPWDTLHIATAGGMEVTLLHVYDSGNLKVRCPNGHIIIIPPDKVTVNYGYQESPYDGLISMLINNRYYRKP